MGHQKEINPKMEDGNAKCNHGKCPQYQKSTFEQYSPSSCKVGGGAGYAPGNLCITWYLRNVVIDLRTADMLHQVLFCLLESCVDKYDREGWTAPRVELSGGVELTNLLMREKESIRRAYENLSKAMVKTEKIGVGGSR